MPEPQAWAVDALSLPWEDLDPHAFPPAAILGKVVEKLPMQDYPYRRINLITSGCLSMPWLWDLVAMSSQIPLRLPNLAFQLDSSQESVKPKSACMVDFRAPTIMSVGDFLTYMFQERKLQPSTIGGYRSEIADKLGNSPINVNKDENLTHLLDNFHRDRPKGRRKIPS